MSCDECARLREELDRLHRLAPSGTYTLNVPYEEEIQRLKDAGEVLVRSLERMTRERDEARVELKILREVVEELRREREEARAERNELQSFLEACFVDGVHTDESRELQNALGMRDGKHTANSICRIAKEEIQRLKDATKAIVRRKKKSGPSSVPEGGSRYG